jgi:hypothetical protein
MVTSPLRFHLPYAGSLLEVSARRTGFRTAVTVFHDGEPVAAGAGIGKILIPVPVDGGAAGGSAPPPTGGPGPDDPAGDPGEPGEGAAGALAGPTVLVLAAVPGKVHRALLLVPRPRSTEADRASGTPAAADRSVAGSAELDEALAGIPPALAGLAGMATAEKRRFAPPPGSLAARLLAFERDHPHLWASRLVVLAVTKVVLGVLGVTAFIKLLLQPVLTWLRGLLPDFDLPSIPWPDFDLPAIPWPDIDLPDLPAAPGWLQALLDTAKFWGPVLAAVGLAVREVQRRRRPADRTEEDHGAHR